MRLLLDTHLYLWFLTDSPRLKAPTRRRIARAQDAFISAASIWEAAVKIGLGRLQADVDALVEQIAASRFTELPVRAVHAAAVTSLPDHHRDPFDRLLVAQATIERIPLLTADEALASYGGPVELV